MHRQGKNNMVTKKQHWKSQCQTSS